MPHLVILYTGNLEPHTDMTTLARALADTMLAQRDEAGAPVFPIGGTRVFAYPAAHFAVADGSADHGFIYLNLRMGRGRSALVHQRVGDALVATARAHVAPLLAARHVGITLQIDVGAEAFDAKLGNLHPLFQKKD
jgi:5-carboxymethyl-2-hydroxymuconate isomerase